MQQRYSEFKKVDLDAERLKVWDEVAGPRKGAVPKPFQMLLESPELCSKVSALGAFCRYRTGLPPRLSEVVILTVATHWKCAYEFAVHTPEARKAGVPEHEISALAEGRRPDFEDKDAALVHDFTVELLQHRDVSNTTFEAALARFGRKTTIELSAVTGYYTLLALTMLATRVLPNAP